MTFHAPPASVRPGNVMAMGKIPSHPEFLQNRTAREPEKSFDEWLEAGMGLAGYRYGPAWTTAFERGEVQGFVWRAPSSARSDVVLSGVLFPSRDSVGRHYPLAVACTVPQRVVMRAPHVIPLAFGDFLERVHEAAADFAALSPAQLASRLVQLGPPSEEDVLRAAADYDAWCIQMPIGGAWSTVFADLPFERSQAAIESLRSATEAIRGVESPAQGLTLRLPLGQGGPGSASLWLDIVRRLCRWNATVPSAFWTVEKGSLLLALGDAPPDVLPALWVRDPASPGVYDLTSSDPAPFSQRLSARPREVRVDAPMTEFLDSVAW